MSTDAVEGGHRRGDHEVVALLTASAAAALEVPTSTLAGVAREAGVRLVEIAGSEIVGARSAEPGSRYFAAALGGRRAAEDLARHLREIEGVDAAYVKPAGEIPG